MPFRHASIAVLRRLSDLSISLSAAVQWLTVLMVAVTFVIVVLRYGFNLGWISLQESVTYLHAVVFMLGASYALRRDRHVRVDIFYGRFSRRNRTRVNRLGSLLLLVPVCVFIIWVSWDYVAASWRLLEGSRETGGLPGVFLLKSLIPLMAGMLLAEGIRIVVDGDMAAEE